MIEKWAHISVLYLLRHKVIKKEDIEIYEFGCHVLYNFIIDMISIIIMAILINQIPQTFFYHIAFIPLRRFTGGYHAKTHLRCFFMSTTLWIISLALVSITYTMPLLSIIIIILSFGLVWVIAPIEHENNPLSMQKRKKMKVICKILSIIITIIIVTLTFMGNYYSLAGASMAYGVLSVAVLLLPEVIKNKQLKK